LLDHLLAARSARVVTVSSDAHLRAWSGIRFGDLTYERGYDPFGAYAHAKLANILFAYELARRTEGTTVTSSAVHPGVVRTGFGRGWQDPFGIVWKLLSPLWLTPERGADSVTYVASAAQLEGVTGRYYYRRRPRRSSPASNNETAAASLWGVSLELTGLA
jgi:NAD(P)-dependent dehydrogenase (short-subunit alcohol dehydrogenase family)